jgi:[ribosomal protein S18]-alanine N-acetyltransferase
MAIARSALEYENLREDHVAGLIDIELDAYPEPWTERMFREEARNPRSYFFVARLHGDIAGYGGFWLVLDEVHITSVTIRRELRRLGYGRELLEHLIATARVAGGRVATLEVRESNEAARQLYGSMGFEPVGVRKGYYPRSGEDAIVMSLAL